MRGSYRTAVARRAGIRPDETGHMPSRIPSGEREGLILKTLSHPTFEKTIEGEKEAGYQFYRKGGKLYSFKRNPGPSYRRVSYDRVRRAHLNARGGRR